MLTLTHKSWIPYARGILSSPGEPSGTPSGDLLRVVMVDVAQLVGDSLRTFLAEEAGNDCNSLPDKGFELMGKSKFTF